MEEEGEEEEGEEEDEEEGEVAALQRSDASSNKTNTKKERKGKHLT